MRLFVSEVSGDEIVWLQLQNSVVLLGCTTLLLSTATLSGGHSVYNQANFNLKYGFKPKKTAMAYLFVVV